MTNPTLEQLVSGLDLTHEQCQRMEARIAAGAFNEGANRVNQQRLLPLSIWVTAAAWLSGVVALSIQMDALRYVTRRLKGVGG